MKFIEHPRIKPNKVQSRIYQQILFFETVKTDTMIILPTGLGKTIIMVMAAAHFLHKFPDQQIIITAPTKPLIDQHYGTFVDLIDIEDSNIILLDGSIPPTKRTSMWENKKIIITTPQTLRNDILASKINLKKVSLLCFDEVHRAVGDDPYVLSGEQYNRINPNGRVLGFTASPNNEEKLREIIKNLGFKSIKYMDDDDPKIKPYIHGSDKHWLRLKLNPEIQEMLKLLKKYTTDNLSILKDAEIIESKQLDRNTKKSIIRLQAKINEMREDIGDDVFFSVMRAWGQIMLTTQAIEMVETQGINVLKSFFDNKIAELGKSKKKSLKNFLNQNAIQEVISLVNKCISNNIRHPKLDKLLEIMERESKNEDSRILIFANYKATTEYLVSQLSVISGIRVHRFVGQSSSNYGKGLSQKQQKSVMDGFRDGRYNTLVSTSVGEEGLDVAQCDLVVFYDFPPSSTRFIQRSGRTGRARRGKIIYLITTGTRDERYYYVAQSKNRKIKSAVKKIMNEMETNQKKMSDENQTKIDTFFDNDQPTRKLGTQTVEEEHKADQIKFSGKDDKILIYIDHRERGAGLLRELLKKDIDLRQVTLPIGDFILSDRVAIERKTVSDFCQSLIDGHLFNQLSQLKSTYLKPMLLIESGEGELCNLTPEAFKGAISSILIDFDIPIIQTSNAKETVQFLLTIARREQVDRKRPPRILQKDSASTILENQLQLLSSIPNINLVLAERLLREFKNIRNIANARSEDLRKIHGIGKNIADNIELLFSEDLEDLGTEKGQK